MRASVRRYWPSVSMPCLTAAKRASLAGIQSEVILCDLTHEAWRWETLAPAADGLVRVARDFNQRSGKPAHVTRRHEPGVEAILEDLGDAADRCGNDGHAGRHRLETGGGPPSRHREGQQSAS